MNKLVQSLENAIQEAIQEYSRRIVDEFPEVDEKDLENLWNSVSTDMKITVKTSSSKRKSSSDDEGNTCPYRFSKGARKGEECGKTSVSGMTYCSVHKKYEGKEMKPSKVLPQNKKSIGSKGKKKKSKSPAKSTKRVIKRNKKLGCVWHEESKLVFKNLKDRVVMGRVKDGKVQKLSRDDVEECKKWGFPFEEPDEDDGSESDNESVEDHVSVSESDEAQKPVKEPDSDDSDSENDEPSTETVYLEAEGSKGKLKFWEGSVTGTTVNLRHGKKGKPGKKSVKKFDTFDKAAAYLEKQMNKKLKHDYKEVKPGVSEPSNFPTTKSLDTSDSDSSEDEKTQENEDVDESEEPKMVQHAVSKALGLSESDSDSDDEL